MNLTDLVAGGGGSKAINAIASMLNVSETKAKWIVAAAVPLMLAALNYNAKKGESKEKSIRNALQTNHDGGVFDHLSGFLGQTPSADGNKIVNHMFGSNTEMVKETLAEKTGVSSTQIGDALAILAPLVMGYLGQQKQSSGGGLTDILGSLIGGSSNSLEGGLLANVLGGVLHGGSSSKSQAGLDKGVIGNLAEEFFNQNNDTSKKGRILDSLAGMFAK